MLIQDWARRAPLPTNSQMFRRGIAVGIAILTLILLARATFLAIAPIWTEIVPIIRKDLTLQMILILLGWGFFLALIAGLVDLYQRGKRRHG